MNSDVTTILGILIIAGMAALVPAKEEIIINKLVPAERLACYVCYERQTEDCVTFKNISNVQRYPCDLDQPYCRVQKLITAGELTTFERACARSCSPGCESALDLVRCTSCCTNSYCNIDDGAACRITHDITLLTALIAMTWSTFSYT